MKFLKGNKYWRVTFVSKELYFIGVFAKILLGLKRAKSNATGNPFLLKLIAGVIVEVVLLWFLYIVIFIANFKYRWTTENRWKLISRDFCSSLRKFALGLGKRISSINECTLQLNPYRPVLFGKLY